MQISDYPTCHRTYATLRIYPGKLDPTEITAQLGIKPSDWQRIGESREPNTPPAKIHGWFLSSEGIITSNDVRKHLDWLISQINPVKDVVLALQANGCRMDISCYWLSQSGHGGPTVVPNQMRILAELNLELWFDVYFSGE